MEAADSGFVPMYLDSSPLDDAQGSGYAECWDSPRARHSVLANPYKPARISFYPLSDNMGSSLPPRFASPGMPPLPSSHPQLYQQVDTTFFCCSPEPMSPQSQVAASFQLSTPSYLELPPPLAGAEFISDLPTAQPALESMESPLPPSDLSEFSWHTSSRLLESDDVPQASFTMSPGESWIEEQPFGEHDDDTSDGSAYSLPGGRTHPILFDEAEWNGATWDAVCLADFLGGLFEKADPWSTLDDFLDVPSLLPDLPPTSTSLFLLASDRGGVGYVATPRSPDWQDLSSQTLAEETRACTPLFSVSCGTEALEDVPAVDSDPPSSGDTAYDDTPEEAQAYLPRAEYEPLSAPAMPSPSPVEMLVKPPGVTVRGPCASIPAAEEDSDVLEEKCGHDASLGTDGADAAVERGIETGVPESFDRDVSVDGPSLFADDDVDLDDE
ncbi:hypothetical protein OH76DRAFT_1476918 [Lentinus brumalis]|uniref:Uncharacterized protein n=1 Tax=Lentinus brumalis TaxID=2498619 RepID=A0A371DYE7_9APHY|nr:hypothetical protein OH76DRAFT_1476918 [Polyporus brumalis]